MARDSSRQILHIDKDVYQEIMNARSVKNIDLYESMELHYPTESQLRTLNLIQEVWKTGDKFYKYAYNYYSDPSLWYVIAFINNTPTDCHVKQGQTIFIPTPIELALRYIHNT